MQIMQNDAVTLQCPNDLCKAANTEDDKFCQRCGMTLLKRYLWAVGEGIEACQIGELVAERYLLKSNRIFLDTKPGLLPEAPYLDISNAIKPYLRLVAYRLQVPQVYGLLPLRQGRRVPELLLLEQAPIYTEAVPLEGQLMPELTQVWKEASSMGQLNWLWQIAQLWQPLSTEGVASSLLEPQLLRVEGSILRLLELRLDSSSLPTLSQLGQSWLQLVAEAKPSIARFLEQLCLALQQGEVQSAEQLIARLDRGLAEAESLQARSLKISTCTDTGPSRQRNEDACYPPNHTTIAKPPDPIALAIVCDGIGGHEGGNVASNLAIETLQQQIQQLPLDDAHLNATTLSTQLERFVCVANDKISQRNDNESRQGRQRMGTTLVMALGHLHEVYIAHVGDSRAYLITRTGCHQITLDDDVASREVRLGYAFYRDALQQPSSGSLVQALGMSAFVHPTVQRFVLDEDCVFLLCSDGLSDYDLVDQCWETEILPILDGKVDVATASQRLVEIGNTQNGHDNVTVGLVYCQVSYSEPRTTESNSLAAQATGVSGSSSPAATVLQDTNAPQPVDAAFSKLNTQLLLSQTAPRRLFVPILLGIILLLGLGGGLLLAYLASQERLPAWPNFGFSPRDARSPNSASPAIETPISSSLPLSSLNKGALLKTKSEIVLSRTAKHQDEAIASPNQQPFSPIKGILPAGSVLQVLDQQSIPQQGDWLNLKVCSIPGTRTSVKKPNSAQNNSAPKTGNVQPSPTRSNSMAATGSRLLQPGEEGLISTTNIERLILPISSLEPEQLGKCLAPTPAATPFSESATVGGESPLERN